MPAPSASNPILAAWAATLAARARDAAILDAAGAVLRTFAQIESESIALAPLLDPLPPGTAAAIRIGNDPRLPALLLALWRRGIAPVPLDLSLDRGPLAAALAAAHASAYITTAAGGPVIELLSPPGPVPGGTDFLKLTSGTTGSPRAIRFTAAQLLADCDAVCDSMGITAADLSYGVIPWSHSYGFSNLITPLLCRGVPLAASADRLPRAILDGLARSRATVFPGVPVFFENLAALDAAPPPALRLCISAGAPLPAATARAFRDRFGLKVHGFYGSSECGGIAWDASDAEVPEGCVGQPMRGVRIELENQPGPSTIRIRSAAVALGYLPGGDPALEGGAFTPGDLVLPTAHGLILAGRTGDIINVAGRKLHPAEIEAVLRACPGVRDAIVFGAASTLRGQEPVAAITGDATVEALRAHCAAALPAWQTPRDFWLLDALPVNERGKLSRRALADAWAARQAPGK